MQTLNGGIRKGFERFAGCASCPHCNNGFVHHIDDVVVEKNVVARRTLDFGIGIGIGIGIDIDIGIGIGIGIGVGVGIE